MKAADADRAAAAASAVAAACGLDVDEALVLHNSNKLTVHLVPCDVVARVAPREEQIAAFEIELAARLVAAGAPVAAPDPRVEPRGHERDGFVITFWTHCEPARSADVAPADYADALARLHACMREIDISAPHFTDRVAEAEQLVASRGLTPDLSAADREFLASMLQTVSCAVVRRGGSEQLLHGEPHPGNLLRTKDGLFFVDLETCCRGPVEFDLAHAPDAVGEHYPGADQDLQRDCRILVLAMITAWRWDIGDQFPNGRQLGVECLDQLRDAIRPERLRFLSGGVENAPGF